MTGERDLEGEISNIAGRMERRIFRDLLGWALQTEERLRQGSDIFGN